MSFGRMISLVIAIAAISALFADIPIISNYAFWFMVLALLIWESVHRIHSKVRYAPWRMVTIVLLLLAIVSVFVYIPIVSDYAFWIVTGAYLIAVGSSGFE